MAAVSRVYAARLAGMVVLGPDGESIGRVRDVVISISIVRQQPRVSARRRIATVPTWSHPPEEREFAVTNVHLIRCRLGMVIQFTRLVKRRLVRGACSDDLRTV